MKEEKWRGEYTQYSKPTWPPPNWHQISQRRISWLGTGLPWRSWRSENANGFMSYVLTAVRFSICSEMDITDPPLKRYLMLLKDHLVISTIWRRSTRKSVILIKIQAKS